MSRPQRVATARTRTAPSRRDDTSPGSGQAARADCGEGAGPGSLRSSSTTRTGPGKPPWAPWCSPFPSLGNFFGALTLHGWMPVHESVDTYHAYAFCCVQAIGATR
jgi:hypothetical protein